MKKYLLVIITFYLIVRLEAQTVSDVDGNTYNTVTIGTQTWMKENLKTTKFKDGTVIPTETNKNVWLTLTTPAYCWYNNSIAYKATYGALYNWYTVNTGKVCPTGWHVPSDNEWTVLATFLGGEDLAGSKLKEAGNTHWSTFNTDATNSSGFTALPGGIIYGNIGFEAVFAQLGLTGSWWSTTAVDQTDAKSCMLATEHVSFSLHRNFGKSGGQSIRCLKDGPADAIPLIEADHYFYPNPASAKLYIKDNRVKDALVIIFDLQGKQVLNTSIRINPIDISGLHKGMYILKITDSQKTVVLKLIKE